MKNLLGLVLLAVSSLSWATPLEELHQRLQGPQAGAHQGSLFTPWANTIKGFERARQAGVDIIEMDLRISKDGVAVVFHDEDLKTWTNCKGSVREKTVAELKACRLTLTSKEKIPTFAEVLDWSQGQIIVDAEFKDFDVIGPAIADVQARNAHAWVYFQAQGNREKFAAASALDPNVALLYAIRDDQEDLDWALAQEANLMIIEVRAETRTPEAIEKIHQAGKYVTEDAWNFVKTYEFFGAACKKAFAAGIDIAISNRPKSCARQRDAVNF